MWQRLVSFLTSKLINELLDFIGAYIALWTEKLRRRKKQDAAKSNFEEVLNDKHASSEQRAKAYEDYINSTRAD